MYIVYVYNKTYPHILLYVGNQCIDCVLFNNYLLKIIVCEVTCMQQLYHVCNNYTHGFVIVKLHHEEDIFVIIQGQGQG